MTDGLPNPLPRKQIHPGFQLLILIAILFIAMIAGTFIGGGIIMTKYGTTVLTNILEAKFVDPGATTALWILQFTSTTFPILITPVLFSYFIVHEPDDYLKYHYHFPWTLIIVVILTMCSAQILIEYLGNINEKMVLPHALKGLEDWMKQSEQDAQKLSDTMMRMPTFMSMIFDLLFIGLLTAIVEETLFRGCMQTIFVRWTKNVHVAIWITAILFSAFHLEFYGFLPRMFLGLLFGYFVAWSGSIWPAILGHFINNGLAVVFTYLYQNKLTSINPDTPQLFTNTAYWISFIVTLVLLFIFWYISNKWHSMHYGEELD